MQQKKKLVATWNSNRASNDHYIGVDVADGESYNGISVTDTKLNGYVDVTSVGLANNLTVASNDTYNCTIDSVSYPSLSVGVSDSWKSITTITDGTYEPYSYSGILPTINSFVINGTDSYNPFAGCFDIIKPNRKRIRLTI